MAFSNICDQVVCLSKYAVLHVQDSSAIQTRASSLKPTELPEHLLGNREIK